MLGGREEVEGISVISGEIVLIRISLAFYTCFLEFRSKNVGVDHITVSCG